jgi:hypothetical protein
MSDLKAYCCENFLHCKGYPEIANCVILAEDKTEAIEMARGEFPDFPEHNWTIEEVELSGNPQIIHKYQLSY